VCEVSISVNVKDISGLRGASNKEYIFVIIWSGTLSRPFLREFLWRAVSIEQYKFTSWKQALRSRAKR
jgi:hypothetical protein